MNRARLILTALVLFATSATANAKCYYPHEWPEGWPSGVVDWLLVTNEAKNQLDYWGVLFEPFEADASEVMLDRVDGASQKLVLKASEITCAEVRVEGVKVTVRAEYRDGRHRVFWIDPPGHMDDSFYTLNYH